MSRVSVLTHSLPAVVALAAAALATPALAQESDAHTKIVHYQDLNLATPEGEASLKHRIAKAAEDVCWEADGPMLDQHDHYLACRSAAMASAQPAVNAVIAYAHSDHHYPVGGSAVAMTVR
jgi:UrcA family protein